MSQVCKSLFSTSAQAKVAERIARNYKAKVISFLDRVHENGEDWDRLMTYVDAKKPELDKHEVVEVMARGNFHTRRPNDPPHFKDRLTLWLLNNLGLPVKAAHLNADGSEDSIVDVSEKDQPKLAAKIREAKRAAAEAEAARARAGGEGEKKPPV